MAYATPTTAAGQILTDAIWNQSVRDNILYLKDRVDNPPRARLTHSTTQSLTSGVDTAVAFNTEAADSTSTMHDTAVNNSRITIPSGEGGWYVITASLEWTANASGQRKLYFRFDGVSAIGAEAVDATLSGVTQLSITIALALNAAQYVEVMAAQNSGGALTLTTNSHFVAQRIA